MRARVLFVATLVASALSSSCFVVTDLDRFEAAPPRAPSNFSDLRVTVRGMTSHVKELFEYRVVDNSDVIQSRGFIVPLGGPDASFFLTGAVPKQNGPFRLDFYADHDNSGDYSDVRPDTTLDHSWRLPLEDKLLDDNDAYVVVFDHNTTFTNLNTPNRPKEFGKPALIHLRGMGGFTRKRVEVRVGDASTNRVVAMHRVPALDRPEFDVDVQGMIETGVSYNIEIYTDNGTGGDVKAFRFEQVAGATGLEATFQGDNPGATPGATEVTDAKPVQ
ncbi:MAG TPA: hypothetical protein VM580_20665 [Labilithrix sp.]|nr:hypothetical protein [Labilithrix sp.]